jgi:2'-5' RNA ligase
MSSARPTDRLFLAAVPDPAIAAVIADLAWCLRQEHGLKGKPLLTQHFHATLWHVGDDFFPPSEELIRELARRASSLEMPPFRVSFDRVVSFSGGALVLRGREGVVGLEMLHEHLETALGVKGTKFAAPAFTPHVTLLRDERRLPSRPIRPIEWTVSEFVLVHSLLGKTMHRHVVRFPLASLLPSGPGK